MRRWHRFSEPVQVRRRWLHRRRGGFRCRCAGGQAVRLGERRPIYGLSLFGHEDCSRVAGQASPTRLRGGRRGRHPTFSDRNWLAGLGPLLPATVFATGARCTLKADIDRHAGAATKFRELPFDVHCRRLASGTGQTTAAQRLELSLPNHLAVSPTDLVATKQSPSPVNFLARVAPCNDFSSGPSP